MILILSNRIDPETLKYVFVSLMIKSPNQEILVESFANLLVEYVCVIESVDGRVVLSQIYKLQASAVLRLFFIVFALSVLHGLDDVHVCVSIPDSLTQQSSQLTSKKPIDDVKIRSIMMIIGKLIELQGLANHGIDRDFMVFCVLFAQIAIRVAAPSIREQITANKKRHIENDD
ncbi:MAG: hypothetical protein EZS28_027126 [Streblomastix strix]|uniref:Uncharacterized protein n=1 Tax=Streblomastix strix TaxID=222440 RepID=A0A5J4V318_9EUKA|nr:MAG: hypothetical protein EZS28_027126 [Streblomastix strix]